MFKIIFIQLGKDLYDTGAVLMLGSNSVLIVVALAVTVYIQSDAISAANAPVWKDVAVGALTLVATLGGLAYRSFVRRMELLEKSVVADRKLRTQQHKSNQRILCVLIEGLRLGKVEGLSATELFNTREGDEPNGD